MTTLIRRIRPLFLATREIRHIALASASRAVRSRKDIVTREFFEEIFRIHLSGDALF